MAVSIRRIEYYYSMVKDRPGEAYQLLSQLADMKVSLLAFNVIPMGPMQTQLALFPEKTEDLLRMAEQTGLVLAGPHHALLIRGDDELGALVQMHARLYDAQINVAAANGVTDGIGSFGYVIYVKPEDYEQAAHALGV
jgi:hypothetical protein